MEVMKLAIEMFRNGIFLKWNVPSDFKGEFLEPMELDDNGDLASIKKKKTILEFYSISVFDKLGDNNNMTRDYVHHIKICIDYL